MKKTRVARKCEICGTIFEPRPAHVKIGWGRFCKYKCKAAAMKIPFEKRFFSKVKKTDTCWIWIGAMCGGGDHTYGQTTLNGKKMVAHRASWIFHNGPIPDNLNVLHNCPDGDNPSCVNPAHLWLGTHEENTTDMFLKGRAKTAYHPPETVAKGERHPRAKLTEETVRAIRREYAESDKHWGIKREIARKFGIHWKHAIQIINRICWRHIP